jgi:predicted CXXCH cytochrome family protein
MTSKCFLYVVLSLCTLTIFAEDKGHIGLPVKNAIDLPLDQGKITCTTCHDKHSPRKKSKTKVSLRKSNDELCLTCHTDKIQGQDTHLDRVIKSKKTISCFTCHKFHAPNKYLLNTDLDGICRKCHTIKKNWIHKKIDMELPTNRLAGVRLDGKQQITCATCHEAHVPSSKLKTFFNVTEELKNYCTSCHGTNLKPIFLKIHH